MTPALLALLLGTTVPPSTVAELQRSVAQAPDGDAQVRAFLERRGGTPIVEGTVATFLAESANPASPPRVVGDWSGSDDGEPLARLGSTRFWFRSVDLPRSARLEYVLRHEGRDTPDPLNPRRTAGFGGAVLSEVRMPGYAPVVEGAEDPKVPKGRVISFEHRSTILGNARRVHVYLPSGYDGSAPRRYPEAWLGDGTSYVESVHVPRILDRLIADGRLEPLIAVFVDPADRRVEYAGHAGHRRMIVEELVPQIANAYRVEGTPARRLIAGGSRGGQMAIDLCLAAPDVFGGCGAWAPAIAPRTAEEFVGPRRTTVRFALVRALFDARFGPDAPALRDALTARGARVTYLEAPQGHTLGAWPDLTALVLLDLLPGEAAHPPRSGTQSSRVARR